MNVQDVVERLVLLGVARDQAEAYVRLSMLGSSKASDLAATLRVSRAIAYRMLEKMEQEGLARATFSRPMRYEAAPAEEVFERLAAKAAAHAANVQRARGELGEVLAKLRAADAPTPPGSTFRLVQGRREIVSLITQFIDQAEERVEFLSTHPGGGKLAHAAGLWDMVASRTEDGVAFRLLFNATPDIVTGAARVAPHEDVQVRHLDVPCVMRMFLRDRDELIMWVVHDPSSRVYAPGDVAIVSSASDLVSTQVEAFRSLWARGVGLNGAAGAPGAEAT